MKRRIVCFVTTIGLLGGTGSVLAESGAFYLLGDLPTGPFYSRAEGVSADGSVVVGWSQVAHPTTGLTGWEAFRWTAQGGMVGLGDFVQDPVHSGANAVSADGSVVVGGASSGYTHPAYWTEPTGWVDLGDLPTPSAGGLAMCVSDDGGVIFGRVASYPGHETFRWTEATGMVGLGDLPGGDYHSSPWDCSADGAVLVGTAETDDGQMAFRWTQDDGMVPLGTLPGFTESSASGCSADGSLVLGSCFDRTTMTGMGWTWTEAEGMVPVANPDPDWMVAYSKCSADGSVLVGSAVNFATFQMGSIVYDDVNGVRFLEDLIARHGVDMSTWEMNMVWDISADGSTIIGWGVNPDGDEQGWVLVLGEDAPAIPEPLALTSLPLAAAWLGRYLRGRS